MICSNCGEALEEGVKFCPYCGQKTEKHCLACGKVIEESAKFCPFCGEAVSKMGNGKKQSMAEAKNVVNELKENEAAPNVIGCNVDQKMDIVGDERLHGGNVLSVNEIHRENRLNEYPGDQINHSEKGTVGKIQQAAQNIKNVLDEDDHITEMTDDEYRNKLASQAKILNVGEMIAFLICVKVVWNYHQIFSLKDCIIAGLISLVATGLISEILGSDNYFGEKRIRRYDKIKKSSSKDEAVKVMENNKGGGIRIILTVLLLTIGTFLISDFCCSKYAEFVIEKRLSEALENLSFSTEEQKESIEILKNVSDDMFIGEYYDMSEL